MNNSKRTQTERKTTKRKGSGAVLTACAVLVGLGGTALLCGAVIRDTGLSTTDSQASIQSPQANQISLTVGGETEDMVPLLSNASDSTSPINDKIKLLEQADQAGQNSGEIMEGVMPDDIPWNMVLVNRNHPVPDGYKPSLIDVGNGYLFDERGAEALRNMLAAAKAEGLSPIICSAYRSVEKQQQLYENQIAQQVSLGYDRTVAEERAGTIVAYPGTSEHNLGLAVDIVSLHNQMLNESQEETPEAKWLAKHCSEYGFILRYPEDKTEITGIIYEPWHFRYVGVTAAKEIMAQGICLEEYFDVA